MTSVNINNKTSKNNKEDKPKATIVPFDRLPNKSFFDQPPKASPYHTKRAEKMRQDSIKELPRETLEHVISTLQEEGKFGVRKNGYKGVFEHNCLTLTAALTYTKQGLKVIDLHGITEGGEQTGTSCKIPRGAKWEKRTSSNSKNITNFWTGDGTYPKAKNGEEYPYAEQRQPRNVGIVISKGMFVLDVDGEEGKKSLTDLEAKYGPLPHTWKSHTGSGGYHFIFSCPVDMDIRNSSNEIAPKIDIRGNGGFIVAPPSIHPTGNFYNWEEGCAPWDCELVEAPEWLHDAAFKATKSRSKSKKNGTKNTNQNSSGTGFKTHLESIGDGEGQKGFDAPIYAAACSWFSKNGTDADPEELKNILDDAILAAPCEDARAENRYSTDGYLDERIEQAREFIKENECVFDIDIKAPLYDEELVDEEGYCDESDVEKIKNQIRENMRKRFTYTIMDGGDPRVFLPTKIGESPKYWKASALAYYFKNQEVHYLEQVGQNIRIKHIKPSELFDYDRNRETFVGTCFEPDPEKADETAFNLWNGFAVEPVEGDWSLLNAHILDNICSGDEVHYAWLMTFLADVFQNPGHKYGSSIAITGEQGTGKSKMFDWVRDAIGASALKVASQTQLKSNFNSHFDAKILVVGEEAFWSGDKAAAGLLKDYITADTINIERKGLDIVTRSNYMRFIFISNENWIIPTDDSGDARRFFVLRCGNKQKQKIDYFKAIDAQMNAGGVEAMAYDLMNWDPEEHNLTWDDLRNPPATDARNEQAGYGLAGPKARLIDIIREGEFTGRLGDGSIFHYVLNESGETPVLRKHLNAILSDGKASNGGAGKKLMEAVESILGKDANQGDSKKKITYLGDFEDKYTAGDLKRISHAESGRWYKFSKLKSLREQVNKKFGD